tara:strand:+ start:60 stop:887 length:828 start_codon:yes stop_codon:yes gene_type:complete
MVRGEHPILIIDLMVACYILTNMKPKEITEDQKRRNKAKAKKYYEANKEKVNARIKAYRESNKEKCQARAKAYYIKNKETIDAKNKSYAEANKEKQKAYRNAHYQKNKLKVSAQTKAWRDANPEKAAKYSKAYRKANMKTMADRQKAYRQSNPEMCAWRDATKRAWKGGKSSLEIIGLSSEMAKTVWREKRKIARKYFPKGLLHHDHVNPLAEATSREDARSRNHFTNFVFIPAAANQSKYAKSFWDWFTLLTDEKLKKCIAEQDAYSKEIQKSL